MDFIGVRDSVEQKFMTAVILQYLSAMALFLTPVVFLGPTQVLEIFPTEEILVTTVIIVLATIAFFNTIFVVRNDILRPVVEMQNRADLIADGRLDIPPSGSDQHDEIGDLKRSFDEMSDYLTTIAAQAEALRLEDFESDVLEKEVPGEIGDAFKEMQTTIQIRIRDLETFRRAIENIGTGIVVYDGDGTIQYGNSAYREMLGTTDPLEGSHITKMNPTLDASRFDDYWNSFDEQETRRNETVHCKLEEEGEFPVATTTTRVTIEGREYHVGVVEDISERKKREQQLRELHEATRRLVTVTTREDVAELTARAARDILEYDSAVVRFVEGNELKPLVVTEQAHAKMGDRPCYPLDGNNLPSVVYTEKEARLVDSNEAYTDEYEWAETQSAMYLPIGEYGVLSITDSAANAFDETDLNLASVLVSSTETALKRLERENEIRKQNERLEKFGRTVAHDLRNPINVIEGYLDVATLADDPREAHEEIQKAINRMTTLVDNLLELAKQGKIVLEPSPASLSETAQAAWEQVETESMQLEVVDEAEILMDKDRVQQIFENLFRNATEHARADGTVQLGILEDGFYIEDDGPGIPKNMQESVFDSGVSTDEKGTGFGLTIVKEIAAAHDWVVSATTGAEGGARFEFREVNFS